MNESAETAPKDEMVDEFGEKLRAFQAFRKSDSEASESILTALGAQDDVDKDIVLELSARRPLGHPERFPRLMHWRCGPSKSSIAMVHAECRSIVWDR